MLDGGVGCNGVICCFCEEVAAVRPVGGEGVLIDLNESSEGALGVSGALVPCGPHSCRSRSKALSAASLKVYTAEVPPSLLTSVARPAEVARPICDPGPGRCPLCNHFWLHLEACGHGRRSLWPSSVDLCRKRLKVCAGRDLRLTSARVRPGRCACEASPERAGRE